MNSTYVHFCPNCGSSDIHPQNITNFACKSCGFVLWNNPKTAVAVVFLKDGKVLMSERGIEPKKGKFDLPGGFVEYGEDPYHAAIRETDEETGVYIKKEDLQLLTAYTSEYLPEITVTDLVFVAHAWSGAFHPQDDSANLVWRPIDAINDERFGPPYYDLAERLHAFEEANSEVLAASALQ